MKRLILSFTLILCSIISTQHAKACVDLHPDSVVINILADTIECNFIIEISNLNMFGGNPNDFCSCGITNSIPDASTILWVAFIDPETQEPLEGFDLWNLSGLAGDSWEDADPSSIDWNGLVADVNDAGIVAGQDVNLWIVLDVVSDDPQWDWLCSGDEGNIWEGFGSFSFGTDEWDNENGVLANSHQSITNFWDSYMTVELIGADTYQSYIDVLENFYSGVEELDTFSISVYPNPSSDLITVSSIDRNTDLVLRDLLGNQVAVRFRDFNQIDLYDLPEGIYILEISKSGQKITKKILVQ